MNNISGKASKLLKEVGVIDCHCDTISNLSLSTKSKYRFAAENMHGHLDLPRMCKGGVKTQFFAACTGKRGRGAKETLHMISCYYRNIISGNEHKIGHVNAFSDIAALNRRGKIAAVLSIEGGEALDGDISMLDIYYMLGVRSLSLTWNYDNLLAGSHGDRGEGKLTMLGRKVVKRMEALGMLVDLAHISPRAFYDVMDFASKPPIVSHANARSICDNSRNLSDEQLKVLSKKGGVVGLTFYPHFIADSVDECSIDKLIDHFVHIATIAGVEVLALGSDFDGIDITMDDLHDCTCYGHLVSGLIGRGFSLSEVELIISGNVLRILEDNIK